MRKWFAVLAAASFMLVLPGAAQAQKPETAKVRLAVGGKSSLYYLPLTITERLGYFKEAGLDVEISDFAGGAKSLQALIGGSADVVAGSFDHTIQMQAKNQQIVAVVQLGRFPGFGLALRKEKAANYKDAKDLKGMKIGVTAPGSSTHFMVLYMMNQVGLKPEDASFIGTGSGGTVVAAVQHGEVDGVSNADPMITKLEKEDAVKVVADTRTMEGTQKVYGGPYPAGVLYAPASFIEKNPNTTQALVNAFVRGLKWVQSHNAEEISKMMPEEYALGDKKLFIESIQANHDAYSPDGRFLKDAPETAYKVLKAFDPNVQNAKIDLSKTFTTKFVEAANAGH